MLTPAATPKRIAVVGAGPAGMATAVTLAERGHGVDVYEANEFLGGQFALAMNIPGKEEFAETIRYFTRRISQTEVRLHLSTEVGVDDLVAAGYDEVVLASGVVPRVPGFSGLDHPSVMSYADLLSGARAAGHRVAVIGAGGIGFDVCEYLTHDTKPALDAAAWRAEWGVGDPETCPGGLTEPLPAPSPREVTLLQRKATPMGRGLGKTTGWVHRASLAAKGVIMLRGVTYGRVDDDGLHITRTGRDGTTREQVISVDSVVICAGQESRRDLLAGLLARGITTHVVGGADVAAELDAKRAIDQAVRLAAAR